MNPAGKKQRTRDKVLLFLSTCSMASTEQIKKHLGVAGKGSKTLNLCLSLRDLGLLIQRSTDGGFDLWIREESPPHAKVIAYLNTRTGASFHAWSRDKVTPSTQADFILLRLEEGITVEQMISVIDMKAKEWLGTNQQMYLRPQTLFNETKCQTYLAQLSMPAKPSTDIENQAVLAWTECERVQMTGAYKSIKDELICRVITKMGGWNIFARMEQRDRAAIRREFLSVYKALSHAQASKGEAQ